MEKTCQNFRHEIPCQNTVPKFQAESFGTFFPSQNSMLKYHAKIPEWVCTQFIQVYPLSHCANVIYEEQYLTYMALLREIFWHEFFRRDMGEILLIQVCSWGSIHWPWRSKAWSWDSMVSNCMDEWLESQFASLHQVFYLMQCTGFPLNNALLLTQRKFSHS